MSRFTECYMCSDGEDVDEAYHCSWCDRDFPPYKVKSQPQRRLIVGKNKSPNPNKSLQMALPSDRWQAKTHRTMDAKLMNAGWFVVSSIIAAVLLVVTGVIAIILDVTTNLDVNYLGWLIGGLLLSAPYALFYYCGGYAKAMKNTSKARESFDQYGGNETKELEFLNNVWIGAAESLREVLASFPELLLSVSASSQKEIDACYTTTQRVFNDVVDQYEYLRPAFANKKSRQAVQAATDVMVKDVRDALGMYEICSQLYVHAYLPHRHKAIIELDAEAARTKLEALMAQNKVALGTGDASPKAPKASKSGSTSGKESTSTDANTTSTEGLTKPFDEAGDQADPKDDDGPNEKNLLSAGLPEEIVISTIGERSVGETLAEPETTEALAKFATAVATHIRMEEGRAKIDDIIDDGTSNSDWRIRVQRGFVYAMPPMGRWTCLSYPLQDYSAQNIYLYNERQDQINWIEDGTRSAATVDRKVLSCLALLNRGVRPDLAVTYVVMGLYDDICLAPSLSRELGLINVCLCAACMGTIPCDPESFRCACRKHRELRTAGGVRSLAQSSLLNGNGPTENVESSTP